MDKQMIEKEIAKSINDSKNIIADEMADAILNEQDSNFIDDESVDKVVVVQVEDKNTPVDDKGEEIEKVEDSSLGKFKNPKELLKAYNELEREFTRRSQRLKELEKSEQLSAESKVDWKEKVDKFFERTPSAKAFAKDIAKKIVDNPDLRKRDDCLEIALNQVLIDNFKTPEQLLGDGQFLDTYVLSSKEIKDKVISQYLKDIGTNTPPTTLMSGGVNIIAPSSRPRSIEEAGRLFLKNNK